MKYEIVLIKKTTRCKPIIFEKLHTLHAIKTKVNGTKFSNQLPCADKYWHNMNQSRTNGPINAHLTIAQVMHRYNHNNEKTRSIAVKVLSKCLQELSNKKAQLN